MTSYTDSSGCCGAVWEGNGAGAVINFPVLTNLAGNPTWAMQCRALAGGQALTNATRSDGRVFIVATQPLLDAARFTNRQIQLSLHGRPGRSYTIESTPDLSNPAWLPAWSWAQTNLVQTLYGLPATGAFQFWRAREQ